MTVRAQFLVLVLAFVAFVALDLSFSGELRDWVRPERALTAVSVLGGFILLSWQLRRQHENSLRADTVKARNELRLAIYREIASVIESASRTINETDAAFSSLKGQVFMVQRLGHRFDAAQHSFEPLHAKIITSEQSVIAVMAALEKWEIGIGPEFQAFKRAFSEHSKTLREAFSSLMAVGHLPPFVPPQDAETFDKLDASAGQVWDAGMDLICDLWDLRVALQNRLLGGLFDWRVPPRTPGDPHVKATIVSTDYA